MMVLGLELAAWLWLLGGVAVAVILGAWLSSTLLWLLAGVVAAALVVFAWWLWWSLPKRQADRFRLTDAKTRADVEDNFRKTAGQLLGGVAVLVGAAFAYLQFTQQQQASRDLLISNQVAKGFELLGNKDNQVEQRLGGIYALEGVMNTSKQYYQPVLEALCAFVRDETKARTGDEPPASDVQAALTVIGRRAADDADDQAALTFIGRRAADEGRPDLSSAHLQRVVLNRANLFAAILSGAYLNGAELHGADLRGALLNGAHLDGADLRGAHLFFTFLDGAHLDGANLRGAIDLTQEQLDRACGTDVELDPWLTIKPCPPKP
jgi:hypothetical protein